MELMRREHNTRHTPDVEEVGDTTSTEVGLNDAQEESGTSGGHRRAGIYGMRGSEPNQRRRATIVGLALLPPRKVYRATPP